MDSGKQIKIGAVISYIAIFVNIVTGIVYTPWMMNSIGKSDYGIYTLAMSLINTFMIDFGLGMAAQRYISKYLAENDQKSADKVVGLIYRLYFLITAVLAIVFTVFYFFLDKMYTKLTPDEMEKFKTVYVIAAVYSVISFPFVPLNGILSAYEKFIQLKLCDLVNKFVSISLTVAALLMNYGVYSLVLVNLIAGIIFIIIRLILIGRFTALRPTFKYKNKSLLKEIFAFSIWTSVSIIALRFFLSLAPSVLGIVSGAEEIAVFGYAVSLETYIYTFVTAINGFFMPRLSRISAGSEAGDSHKNVENLMISVGRFILMLFALIFIGFAALGREFINLLFGSAYNNSYYCTLLICGYGIIAYPQQIANTYTVVQNKVKKRAIASIITLAIDLVLSFVFGKFWGALGAATAVFISLNIYTVIMNIIYKKDLGIDIFRFFKECHLKLLPGFILQLAVSFAISYIPLPGWTGFAIKVALIVAAYILNLFLFMLNKAEKNMIFRKGFNRK